MPVAVPMLVLAVALAFPASSGAVTLNFPDFSSTAGLDLNGNAEATDTDVLRLTDNQGDQEGSAFTEKKVIDPGKSFSSKFTFNINTGSADPSDGIAFVLHRESSGAVGGGGGGMGYANIEPSVAIEFDTWHNIGVEPDGNHVGAMLNGDHEDHKKLASPAFDLYGGDRWAWVNYSAKKKKTKVWVSDSATKPSAPTLTYKKKLKGVLGGKARAGFTAATGGDFARHDILSWKLKQR